MPLLGPRDQVLDPLVRELAIGRLDRFTDELEGHHDDRARSSGVTVETRIVR